jgi:uncharacterized damage-inducible protein DinB
MKKMTAKTFALLVFAFILASFQSNAQPLNNEDLKAQLIKDWERGKDYTISYLNTMPADKYSFKAVDSIRSFAQQMLHLSQGNMNLMALVTGQPKEFGERNLEESTTAQTKDSVMYYVTTSYDFAINGLKKMDASKLGEKVKFFDFEETKYVFALKAFEHQTHHRGQTTIYIRLLGIRPPQERLF